MNFRGVMLWGWVGTVVLTSIMSASQSLGLTRMNLPFMLGAMFRRDHRQATLVGSVFHMAAGLMFATIYAAAFESWRAAGWWRGASIGLVHGLAVLLALLPALPAMHPRMASETAGPTPTRQLEPPGFLGLNYGRRTPISVMIAHLAFGAILGRFYRLRR